MKFQDFQEDWTNEQCSKILEIISEFPAKMKIQELYFKLQSKYPEMFDFNLDWQSNRDFQNYVRFLQIKNIILLSRGSLLVSLSEKGRELLGVK